MPKKTETSLKIKYDQHNGKMRARASVTYIDGTKGRMEAHGNTEAVARKALMEKIDEKNEEIRYGKKKENGEITLKEAVLAKIEERRTGYDRNKKREKIRDSTSQREMDVYKRLLLPHEISNKQIKQIFYKDLDDYRKFLETAQHDNCQIKDKKKHIPEMQYYSASTLNRVIRLVRSVIDEYYCHSEYKSPAEALTTFTQTVTPKTANDFLMGKEIQTVLDYFSFQREQGRYGLDATYADMFSLGLMLGCRPGELRGLKKRDWNVEQETLAICRTGDYEDGRTKTETSKRVLPVTPHVEEILNRRCRELKPNDYIFANTLGGTLSESNANKKLKRWLAEAGIDKDLHFHSLRGSTASNLLENDVDVTIVSSLLGHSKIDTTMKHYIAISENKKRLSLERMEEIYT